MKIRTFIIAMIATLCLASCSDITEIAPPGDLYPDEVFDDITRAQNAINSAYGGVPRTPPIALEYYTDNAVSKSVSGRGITAESSPVDAYWYAAMSNQLRINEFLDKGIDIDYSIFDPVLGEQRKNRILGEAYGLRAYYKWSLLKNFAGPSAKDSTLLGFPIIDDILTTEGIKDVPRASYGECYTSIMNDIDTALVFLQNFKKRYGGNGDVDGNMFISRVCGEMLVAMKARLALYAASEAYNYISWEAAVDTIASAINYTGGLIDLQSYGDFNSVNNLDHFWRVSHYGSNSLEYANFPPSLFGNGNCNPTQNFAEAFGDAYGYPYRDEFAYKLADDWDLIPFEERDNRFHKFFFYNGKNEFKNADIQTYEGGADASGTYTRVATRTSYYMKKFLSPQIEFDVEKGYVGSDYKVYPIFTRTGLYLDFAEASANASYGILGKAPGVSYSAFDVICKVRYRVGTSFIVRQKTGLDYYMQEVILDMADIDAFKKLIRNDRRIEYAFEGERFYDVRRQKLKLDFLNQDLRGLSIVKADDGTLTYDESVVIGQQYFAEHMYYNPIPREEVLKSNAIVQNAGW